MLDCQKLSEDLQKSGFSFKEEIIEKWTAYLNGIETWNKAYNLTAFHTFDEMIVKHLFDSIVVSPFIEKASPRRIIDVGTGAGIPGFLLAILHEDIHFTLLDSNSKRIRFMHHMMLQLKVKNVELVHSRVQDYKPLELYDIVLSRAFASAFDMTKWSAHLVNENGAFWAMKGKIHDDEWNDLSDEYTTKIIPLNVPRLDENRHLVLLNKK